MFQAILGDMGCDFGFRVIHDMMMYLYLAWEEDREPAIWNGWTQAMDAQIVQQILPRIQGSEKRIRHNLRALYGCCFDQTGLNMQDNMADTWDLDCEGARYKHSARKLRAMQKELERMGFVSFIP